MQSKTAPQSHIMWISSQLRRCSLRHIPQLTLRPSISYWGIFLRKPPSTLNPTPPPSKPSQAPYRNPRPKTQKPNVQTLSPSPSAPRSPNSLNPRPLKPKPALNPLDPSETPHSGLGLRGVHKGLWVYVGLGAYRGWVYRCLGVQV